MAKNYVGDGDEVQVTLSGTVSSGDLMLVSTLALVALSDGISGETIAAKNNGEWTLACDGTAASQYDAAYWDAGNNQVTNTSNSGANQQIGLYARDVTAGDATCVVLLNGLPD